MIVFSLNQCAGRHKTQRTIHIDSSLSSGHASCCSKKLKAHDGGHRPKSIVWKEILFWITMIHCSFLSKKAFLGLSCTRSLCPRRAGFSAGVRGNRLSSIDGNLFLCCFISIFVSCVDVWWFLWFLSVFCKSTPGSRDIQYLLFT